MQKEIAHASSNDLDKVIARETILGLSISFTAGFLIWVLRGGALLASLISLSPLWRQFDPLPIVDAKNSDADNKELAADERVENLFETSTMSNR